MTYEQLWLAAAILLFVLEILTPGFVLANFGVAAIAAAVAGWLGAGIEIQVLVFAVVCLVSFVTIRPIFKHTFIQRNAGTPTGMDALIGREAMVTEEIPGGIELGRVQIDGDSWRAIAHHKGKIEQGTRVKVLLIDSTTLIVTNL